MSVWFETNTWLGFKSSTSKLLYAFAWDRSLLVLRADMICLFIFRNVQLATSSPHQWSDLFCVFAVSLVRCAGCAGRNPSAADATLTPQVDGYFCLGRLLIHMPCLCKIPFVNATISQCVYFPLQRSINIVMFVVRREPWCQRHSVSSTCGTISEEMTDSYRFTSVFS